MQIVILASTIVLDAVSTAADVLTVFVNRAPESLVLAIWGGLLLLAAHWFGQRLNDRETKPDHALAAYLTPLAAKPAESEPRRAWSTEIAVAER